eukprot:543305_1
MSLTHILIFLCIFLMHLLPTVYGQNSGTCIPQINCNDRGTCVTDDTGWHCKCVEGFTTYPEPTQEEENRVYCNYQQKDQLVAFLLSFFLGLFAAGRFYCHLYMSASLKVGLNLGLGCYGFCIVSMVTGVSFKNRHMHVRE